VISELIYVDTSFYLGILLKEPEALKINKSIGKASFCSSVFLISESQRNLIRLIREKKISLEDGDLAMVRLREDQRRIVLKELSLELCLGAFPSVRIPRSSDLLHLRTASWFQSTGKLAYFVSMDSHQLASAEDLGIPIFSKKI
jgi:predicted nucleic acid-binding protein